MRTPCLAPGYRNGYWAGRLKTAEGAVEYGAPQIADRAEHSAISFFIPSTDGICIRYPNRDGSDSACWLGMEARPPSLSPQTTQGASRTQFAPVPIVPFVPNPLHAARTETIGRIGTIGSKVTRPVPARAVARVWRQPNVLACEARRDVVGAVGLVGAVADGYGEPAGKLTVATAPPCE
jgi:hypothetical protein